MTTTIGYLHTDTQRGTITLAVPCEPCRAFHWHGAGTVEQPYYSPGDLTDRRSHCHNGNNYSAITISPEPYRPEWVTPQRGRFSAAYRREVAR
ncbi:hypothetical protein FHX75_13513 [Micromonospora palomenae]|uniref:Uncharacterized protein n=1 Tax=Micromonospora palomenae TaxID=1461247 RepID=A0A561VPC3_9ACTN|nr:hypothetical protein [Micromonospora palomenae]TWG13469.1 hypothetical protein FHX75_13513 [Micromonospora palomenae]